MMAALEGKRSPEYDIPSTSTNTSVSTTCKSCKKEFAVSTIFKHVSHRPTCKANYTNEEIQAFKNWKRERDEAGRNRKKHDPVKRKERYLREKEKKITSSLSQDEEKSSSEYVSSQCLGCKVNFTKATILKHISHSPSCRNVYTKDDISELVESAFNSRCSHRFSLRGQPLREHTKGRISTAVSGFLLCPQAQTFHCLCFATHCIPSHLT